VNWYSKFTFHEKVEGLSVEDYRSINTFLSAKVSEAELEEIRSNTIDTSTVDAKKWGMPSIVLPDEYISLLRYSNGGLIVNGEREFGFFGRDVLREYCLCYEFPEYMLGALPIGLNGGGVFYAYDFRKKSSNPNIIAIHACNLDWDDAIVLGTSLEKVLSIESNIEDEM
jgi:hypothetical protein